MIKKLRQTIKIAPPSTVEGVLQNQFVYGGSCGLGLSVLLCSGLITYAGVATSNPYFTWAGIGFVLAGTALCWCIGLLARRERRLILGLEHSEVRGTFNARTSVQAIAKRVRPTNPNLKRCGYMLLGIVLGALSGRFLGFAILTAGDMNGVEWIKNMSQAWANAIIIPSMLLGGVAGWRFVSYLRTRRDRNHRGRTVLYLGMAAGSVAVCCVLTEIALLALRATNLSTSLANYGVIGLVMLALLAVLWCIDRLARGSGRVSPDGPRPGARNPDWATTRISKG